jgi:hypothetical protein
MAEKPDEVLRKKLKSRGERNLKGGSAPTPSEKRSKAFRKKRNRTGSPPQEVRYDCNRCPHEPCGKTLGDCGQPRRIVKCKHCGFNYTYRFDLQYIFDYCTPCRISLERKV